MAGPAAGRPRPIPRRWDEIEQQIQSCRSKYETIEQQRGKKLLEYDALKKKDQPEKIDASTVVVRNAIDKVLAELHQNMEDSRDNTQEAAEILSGTIFTREIWEPTLRPAPGAAATQPLPAGVAGQRKEAWLKGLERWEKEGPEGFARAVLGDQFGLLVLQTLPERIWRPEMFLTGRGGAGPFPLSGPALDEIRQNWLARIDRMERQQEDLANEMRRQDRELRQMRMILDNLLNQPGPGPDPSNPGPTPPEENKK